MAAAVIQFKFDPQTVKRRAALSLLPNVKDPELDSDFCFSQMKSSKTYVFKSGSTVVTHDNNNVGYSLTRSTRALINPGKYYWEIAFVGTESGQGHCRIGISTIKAAIEGPVGYDPEGYALRDAGDAFHNALKHSAPGFKPGDVVGFGLNITDNNCSLECWINGENHTELFADIPTRPYYIAVSTYRDAVIKGAFDKSHFQFYPGDEWTAAADHPVAESNCKYDVDELLRIMSDGSIKLLNEELITIINQAMAPPEDLPT